MSAAATATFGIAFSSLINTNEISNQKVAARKTTKAQFEGTLKNATMETVTTMNQRIVLLRIH